MRYLKFLLLSVLILGVSGCPDDTGDTSSDSRISDGRLADVGPDTGPAGLGQDVDKLIKRTLSSSYKLPAAFNDALKAMGLDRSRLTFPDLGLTKAKDPTRLHWTDTIRHAGDRAPTLGYMVIEDVTAAVTPGDSDTTARELLGLMHAYNSTDAFRQLRYDRRIDLSKQASPLMYALEQFYKHKPVEGHPSPPTKSWAQVKAGLQAKAATFPQAARRAIGQAIVGLVQAADLRHQALTKRGKMTIKEWSALHTKVAFNFNVYDNTVDAKAHPGFDFTLMAKAGQLALRSVESLRLALRDVPLKKGASLELLGPLGRVVISLEDRGNTWSHHDVFLLVDGGGHDTYRGHLAANTTIYQPVSVVLDLKGNDSYKGTKDWSIDDAKLSKTENAMQGAALMGVAILDDASGDDSYLCSRHCQGAALFGVGVLLDHAGKDQYRGYHVSQGAAEMGFGLLLDRGKGADRYETLQNSQGYGGPRGIGLLVDDGGDDRYLAIKKPLVYNWAGEGHNFTGGQGFGFGYRGGPYLSGGLGALLDLGGDDSYQCSVMCLGFGYFFGTGLMYDAAGKDRYEITHKYGLGSATHQSVGLFIDGAGADTYLVSGNDEAIALGYDHGVAFHIDRGKDGDSYTVDKVGDFVLGFARHPAMGVLINEGGDDTYNLPPGKGTRSLGRSHVDAKDRNASYAKTTVTLGLFMDLGGKKDTYPAARADTGNGKTWRQTTAQGAGWTKTLDYGYGVDSE